jgi:hypothetical protein
MLVVKLSASGKEDRIMLVSSTRVVSGKEDRIMLVSSARVVR